MKRFVCADLHAGCGRVFTGPGDQAVLDQVLAHAAADHDLPHPSMAFIEQVVIATHPVLPTRGRRPRHLALVGTAAPHRSAAVSGTGHPGPVGHGAAAACRASAVTALTDRHGRPHRTYRHECWLYRGEGEFMDLMVPFIADGLAREQPVMVAVPEPRLGALRDALGGDAERVRWADMTDLGGNPARIIPAWQDFTDRHAADGRPVRGIGQPIWPGRPDGELAEAQFHEALLNLAVAPDTPLWLLCPYDTSSLPDGVIAEAHRSHPVLADSGGYRGSTRYGGAHHAAALFDAPLPAPAVSVTVIPPDPDRRRHVDHLLRYAAAAGLPADRAAKLAAAADEITTASGHSGRVRIRVWQDDTTMLCEITDPAVIDDPMTGRPATAAVTDPWDRAIRLANDLCDLVQVRSGPDGTTIRIHQANGRAPCA